MNASRIILGLALCAAALAGCGGDDDASGEVVLYTSMPQAVVDQLDGVIEQRFPDLEGNVWIPVDSEGITLTVVRGRTADIQQLIADEIASGEIKADLIWLAEPSPYEAYKEQGLLAPLDPPPGAPIPPEYTDPDGFYVAGRVISMVVAWNPTARPEGLDDWSDLLEAQPAAFPAPASGAARATISALLDLQGQQYFTTFAEAGATSVPSNGAARDGLIQGTYDAVAVLDYMARSARDSGADIDFAYPASGTVLIPSPIALTADAPNPAAAKAVVDFILSQPGQQIIVEIGSFYPVRTDVTVPAGAPPLDQITALPVDWKALPAQLTDLTRFWEETYGTPVDSD